jgi:hypothetical protein
MDEIRAILQNAIIQARPPHPPPSDKSPHREAAP